MATIASIDTAVRANTSNFERGMNRARGSLKGFTKEMGFAVKLAKGGGAFLGATFIASSITSFADKFTDLKTEFQSGKIDINELNLELGKGIPILGAWIRLVDSVGEAFSRSRKEANALVDWQERRLELVKKQNAALKVLQDENAALGFSNQADRDRALIRSEFQRRVKEIESSKFDFDRKQELVNEAEIIAQKKMQKVDEQEAVRGFGGFNFLEDSIRFMEQQAEEIKRIQDAIATEAEMGIQRSVEAQEMANERAAKDFIEQRLKAASFEQPLFAETATFGSLASFEARRRFLRPNDDNSPEKISRDILKEAKEQNLNLQKVIEALRDQFPAANL